MKQAKRVHQKIKSGEESEVQGLLEQWLRDGKLTEMEALLSATDMFTAGVDSVRICNSMIIVQYAVNIIKLGMGLPCEWHAL